MWRFSNKLIPFTKSVSDTDVSFSQILQHGNVQKWQKYKWKLSYVTSKEITSREVKL